LSILKPPHNHFAIFSPTPGIAEARLVITVAPQKLICPHGSTYPIKAIPSIRKNIKTPEYHNGIFL
jgi:hypothetical protein